MKRSRTKVHRRPPIWNDAVIISFAIASIILLALELSGNLSPAQIRLVRSFDLIVALTFLFEFIYRLRRTKNKLRFLIWHWWEILACIPVTNTFTQGLRGLKFIRILELVRILRVSSRLEVTGEVFGGFTEHPYVVEAISTILAIVFGGGVGFYVLEYGHNANIHSLWDAFWWAATTMTTTGYGDIYPVTTAGRVLAMGLMFTGIVSAALLTSVMVRYIALRNRA